LAPHQQQQRGQGLTSKILILERPNFIYTDQAGLFGMRTEGAYPIVFYTNGANERLRIDSSGNVLVTNPALLGYGTGAGGTVTQGATSGKLTAVTLNKTHRADNYEQLCIARGCYGSVFIK